MTDRQPEPTTEAEPSPFAPAAKQAAYNRGYAKGIADERDRLAVAVRGLVWIRASNGKVAIDAGDVYAIFGLDDLQPDTASAERGE